MAETRDSRFSRNLLPKLPCGGGETRFPVKPKEEQIVRSENVELSLGLSLNGRFAAEPRRTVANDDKKLFRASSVTDFVNFSVDLELSLYSPLTRTCSLPLETEGAEWRKRKELQSLRRSEAKRKRVEKLKNVRVVKGKTGEDLVTGIESSAVGSKQSPPSSPSPAVGFSSPGSIRSQGSGGSSGISDLDSQRSPGVTKDTSEIIDAVKVACYTTTRPNPDDQTMPCVSTKGDGPNGKRIQGFLYKYGKGEEVRIICVCHGSILTPVEFVKHGGGGDVDHPLRHIVVTASLFG